MLTEEFLSTRWRIRISLSNNKIDQYVVRAAELMKFINVQRRIERKLVRKGKKKGPVKSVYPLGTWLLDLVHSKHEDYVNRFNMENVEIYDVNIKLIEG